MIPLSVRLEGFDALAASLGDQARQIPFAASLALNATARSVRTATLAEMAAQFDRPTPLVMKSLFIAPATKAKLQAAVYLEDREIGGKNSRSMAEILGHQFAGGTRLRKRMENAFTAAGLISLGEYLVPGPDAKLDQYGNLSRGQAQQIYAALRLFRDPYQNATQSPRSQRHAKAAGRIFWSDGKGANKRRRGLWATDGRGFPKLLMLVIPTPVYRRRIDMDRLAADIVDRDFPANFDAALKKALATAR